MIRVTLDRRAQGNRTEIAMSPSVVDELVESFYDRGSVRFNADEDLAIELDLEVSYLDPEEEARIRSPVWSFGGKQGITCR